MLLCGRYLRLESQRLDAGSVGLRRSEIDGYFLEIRSSHWMDAFCDWNYGVWVPARSAFCSHLCPQRCSPTLWRLVFENSDRKFGHAIVGPLLMIGITAVGRRLGRASSLRERRLLASLG